MQKKKKKKVPQIQNATPLLLFPLVGLFFFLSLSIFSGKRSKI